MSKAYKSLALGFNIQCLPSSPALVVIVETKRVCWKFEAENLMKTISKSIRFVLSGVLCFIV